MFTAFADTASYLFDALQPWARKELGIHVALVTGGGANRTTFGNTDFNQILTNFSPAPSSGTRFRPCRRTARSTC